MKPIFDSRKTRLGLFAIGLGVVMAFALKAAFLEWSVYTAGMFTAIGVGIQSDKVIDNKGRILDEVK